MHKILRKTEKMLQARQINDRITVSPQIQTKDIADIAAAGYKSIICNRPDNEEPGQPAYADIKAEAEKCGLEIRWQPVTSGAIEDQHAHQFEELLHDLPAPTFAYCRSGTRSVILWSLSQASQRPAIDIVREATTAGYDLTGLAPRLEAIASTVKS